MLKCTNDIKLNSLFIWDCNQTNNPFFVIKNLLFMLIFHGVIHRSFVDIQTLHSEQLPNNHISFYTTSYIIHSISTILTSQPFWIKPFSKWQIAPFFLFLFLSFVKKTRKHIINIWLMFTKAIIDLHIRGGPMKPWSWVMCTRSTYFHKWAFLVSRARSQLAVPCTRSNKKESSKINANLKLVLVLEWWWLTHKVFVEGG